MSKTQISKIILRKGESFDLPGKPKSLQPLEFNDGLDAGEMAFITDTGKIYIGSEPTIGHPQFDRITFPYQNIEVLTENSLDTIQNIVYGLSQEEDENAYIKSSLLPNTDDYNNVIVPRVGDDSYIYNFPFQNSLSVKIEYSAFDSNNRPIKTGELTVRYFEGESEPTVSDISSTLRRNDLLIPEATNANRAFEQVEFKFIVSGPLNARFIAFQYKNFTESVIQLRFKTSRPKA